MDFIAEMVLGYVDQLLTIKLQENNIEDYQILRYRDDYRIFVNSHNIGENILKLLSEVLMPFGLKLNSSKTKSHQDVIIASIKKDKFAWLQQSEQNLNNLSLQKHLLLIKQHALQYPNSGSLMTALNGFHERVQKEKQIKLKQYFKQIIAIITDIAYNNPKSLTICCAIISRFLLVLDNDVYKNTAIKVYNKLKNAPNSGFAQIWLQRILKEQYEEIEYIEPLCQIVFRYEEANIWNHSWIESKKLLKILNKNSIFDQNIFDSLDKVVKSDEFDVFFYSKI